MTDLLRIAGYVEESTVDGPGLRFTIFVQGCPHHCPGCHNPETHDPNGGFEIAAETLFEKMRNNPLLDGLALSGGEPFDQAAVLAALARRCRDELGFSVVTYTGYRYEELSAATENAFWQELLAVTDLLIDGPFDLAQHYPDLRFRGSFNQRLIDLRRQRQEKT